MNMMFFSSKGFCQTFSSLLCILDFMLVNENVMVKYLTGKQKKKVLNMQVFIFICFKPIYDSQVINFVQ